MKFALVHNERQEAQPGLIGNCICCRNPTIAKCGDKRIRHWAHKAKLVCDPWWEETEWHRAWKERFPNEWQEVIRHAESGEKHIADVKIDQGYVIEFQHFPIQSSERQAREDFYDEMIWIVDGKRRLRDKDKFINVWEDSNQIDNRVDVRRLRPHFDECALLRDWCDSEVPVFFDFGEEMLWGLRLRTIENRVYAFKIGSNELIAYLCDAPQTGLRAFLKGLDNFIIKKEWESFTIQQNSQHQKIIHPSRQSIRRRL